MIEEDVLRSTTISIDQKYHDNVTGYQSGAITLYNEIKYTKDYANASTSAFLGITSHEVGHRVRADQLGFALSYYADVAIGYGVSSVSALVQEMGEAGWTGQGYKVPENIKSPSFQDKVHDFALFEKDADQFQDRWFKFRDTINKNTNTKFGVEVNRILNNADMDDAGRSAAISYIIDTYYEQQ